MFDPAEQLCLALNFVQVWWWFACLPWTYFILLTRLQPSLFQYNDLHEEVHLIDNTNLNISNVLGEIPWGRGWEDSSEGRCCYLLSMGPLGALIFHNHFLLLDILIPKFAVSKFSLVIWLETFDIRGRLIDYTFSSQQDWWQVYLPKIQTKVVRQSSNHRTSRLCPIVCPHLTGLSTAYIFEFLTTLRRSGYSYNSSFICRHEPQYTRLANWEGIKRVSSVSYIV